MASAMFAGSRLRNRPGFAGVENVQLYVRSETLQMYRLMSCPANIEMDQSEARTTYLRRQTRHENRQRLVMEAPPR